MKIIKCGVPWCIALVVEGRQYCVVHVHQHNRSSLPPLVQKELEVRFLKAMRKHPDTDTSDAMWRDISHAHR